ncbi:hypothetical protein DPMN_063765 [Dreissena polymorpha]|uniref:Uncharacterized protein n=1 Tax=Dreissena polymorpha TaxID=45954 RepID=A0A9D4CC28_DREPO|nr:hypothetical protein DPMN_063765 [Dreissena polymorpha]
MKRIRTSSLRVLNQLRAEAKKSRILVLKQMLSKEENHLVKGSAVSTPSNVTDTYNGENCRTALAESTRIDIELANEQHQSALQKSQSRTTLANP